jgi:hypothetical protein
MYANFITCGFIRGDVVNMLPAEGEAMQAGDQLVAVSRDLTMAAMDARSLLNPCEISSQTHADAGSKCRTVQSVDEAPPGADPTKQQLINN